MTLWTVALQTPLSMDGILQARILKWFAISYSRISSQPRDQICVPRRGQGVGYEGISTSLRAISPRPAITMTITHAGCCPNPCLHDLGDSSVGSVVISPWLLPTTLPHQTSVLHHSSGPGPPSPAPLAGPPAYRILQKHYATRAFCPAPSLLFSPSSRLSLGT